MGVGGAGWGGGSVGEGRTVLVTADRIPKQRDKKREKRQEEVHQEWVGGAVWRHDVGEEGRRGEVGGADGETKRGGKCENWKLLMEGRHSTGKSKRVRDTESENGSI